MSKRPKELNCPHCKGAGFYLKHEGRGYYRDGSFGHNQWEDCDKCGGSGDIRETLNYRYPVNGNTTNDQSA